MSIRRLSRPLPEPIGTPPFNFMKLKRIIRGTIKWIVRAVVVVIILLSAWLFIAYWRSSNDCESLMAAPGERMKAIVYCDYGPPDVLKLADIAKPVPNDDQVLIKVRAASVNPYDWHFMRGEPYVMRMESGLRKPKSARFGVDFAGTVEAAGKNITQFKPGDEVFGGKTGAFAEYIVTSEKFLIPKPSNLSFEQAAAVQIAGMTALQGLRAAGKLQPGQKVLINGASGGVGTFAVQIGKSLGAHVTGVCSTRNVEMVRALGADHVIDYTKEDFTKGAERYDVMLDMVGNHGLLACRRVLTPDGRYVMIGGRKGKWLAPMDSVLRALLVSPFVEQEMGFMISQVNRDDQLQLRDLMQSGKLTPVIDRTYKLSKVAEAVAYVETGRARGKVVIVVE